MLPEKDGFAITWSFEDSVDRACELLGLFDPDSVPAEDWPAWTDDFSWEVTDPDLEWFPCEPDTNELFPEEWTQVASMLRRTYAA